MQIHGPTDVEWSVDQVHAQLTDTPPATLLDVRADWEFAMGHLPNAQHLPLSQLAEQLPTLPLAKSAQLVTYCHHGVRSLRAAQMLRAAGYTRVVSMAGGIDAWSNTVDASVPRY